MRENPALSKNDLCQALIQIPALSLPIQFEQVRHSPTGSILRITETACSRENLNCRDVNLQTVWDSEETRPYHSEEQEGGPKPDVTAIKRRDGKKKHMVLVQTGEVEDP